MWLYALQHQLGNSIHSKYAIEHMIKYEQDQKSQDAIQKNLWFVIGTEKT